MGEGRPLSGVADLRRLLTLLRDIMKGAGSTQEKLDGLTTLIAQSMQADVCSLYVLRPGEVLELFATKGLRPEAVHRTRLRVGEGLVGEIARSGKPGAYADARSQPQFAYRAETGEDSVSSLLGVPLLRDGAMQGVLVVQTREPRDFEELDIEVLETVSMLLAELVAGGEVIAPLEARYSSGQGLPLRLSGIVMAEGIAVGEAVASHGEIHVPLLVAEDPVEEARRLAEALEALTSGLAAVAKRAGLRARSEEREIFDAIRMFADDRGWRAKLNEAVASGLTAEAAVQRVQGELRKRLEAAEDSYLRARLADFDELAEQLKRQLLGLGQVDEAPSLPPDAVLVGRVLGPAEFLALDRERLQAVVIEEGSPSSHLALLARALGVPMVGRCHGAVRRIAPGDPVVVDADSGQVLVRPRGAVRKRFADAIEARRRRRAELTAERDLPAVTRDGRAISLKINAGLLADLPHLESSGAEGVGLYRTELPFMVRDRFPDVAEQHSVYRRVLELAGDKPVAFRTLDIGGDKALPYWSGDAEENPAMGWRAIRIGLDRPALLRQQLRALLSAGAGRSLWLMFPMVSSVEEFLRARRLVEMERERLRSLGLEGPEAVKLGIMIEVPSVAWQLTQLLPQIDFLSIGTNDLLQFFFAIDRGSPRLSGRAQALSPAFLSLLADIFAEADAAGVPTTVCGEMAGRPLDAMALLGIGCRALSMPPAAVAEVKAMLRSLEAPPLESFLSTRLASTKPSLRGELIDYARDHGVLLP